MKKLILPIFTLSVILFSSCTKQEREYNCEVYNKYGKLTTIKIKGTRADADYFESTHTDYYLEYRCYCH